MYSVHTILFFAPLSILQMLKSTIISLKESLYRTPLGAASFRGNFQKLHFWGNFSPVHCGIWSGTQELLDQQLKQEAYIYIPGYVNSLIFLWFWHFYNKCIFDSLKCQIKRAAASWTTSFLAFTKECSNHSSSRW